MSRIVEIYKFIKNEDKTRASLNNFLVESEKFTYAYASNMISHLVASEVLVKNGGYIIINPRLKDGFANLE